MYVFYMDISIMCYDKYTLCKYHINDKVNYEHSFTLSVLPLHTPLTCLSALWLNSQNGFHSVDR